jgi:hypothetical protein
MLLSAPVLSGVNRKNNSSDISINKGIANKKAIFNLVVLNGTAAVSLIPKPYNLGLENRAIALTALIEVKAGRRNFDMVLKCKINEPLFFAPHQTQ